jgi:hypothetical protein
MRRRPCNAALYRTGWHRACLSISRSTLAGQMKYGAASDQVRIVWAWLVEPSRNMTSHISVPNSTIVLYVPPSEHLSLRRTLYVLRSTHVCHQNICHCWMTTLSSICLILHFDPRDYIRCRYISLSSWQQSAVSSHNTDYQLLLLGLTRWLCLSLYSFSFCVCFAGCNGKPIRVFTIRWTVSDSFGYFKSMFYDGGW